MVTIRRTSKVVPFEKTSGKGVSGAGSAKGAPSPFAISAPDPLKAITERQSKLGEKSRLAVLQRAFEPYAEEARRHLPPGMQKIEKKVRYKMIKEGFPKEIANEAGDEAVTALLDTKSK